MPKYHTREIEFRADETVGDLIPCVLSSETPVERGQYLEVLSHTPADVDLSRAPLPLLVQHDRTQLNVGVIEQIRLVGGKLLGAARFGASALAQEIRADVLSRIINSLSVGYRVIKPISESGRTVRFAWQPLECSIVSVPADENAGFWRSINQPSKGKIMPDNNSTEITDTTDQRTRSQVRSATRSMADERERASEIFAIGRVHNLGDLAERAVADGTSLDDFRNLALSRMRDSGSLRLSESPEIGMSRGEIERFSFRRAILSRIDPQWGAREAGFEMEVSRAYAKQIGKDPQGIFVPPEVLQHRDMTVGTPSAGGHLVATEHMGANFIDVLRQASMVMALGATNLAGLTGNVAIPRKTGTATVYWVPENGAPPPSAIALDQIGLTPKTVAGYSDYSRRLLQQATPDIESLLRRDFAETIAVELDRVVIIGAGTSTEPRGILNTSGIGSVAIGANGGPITWDHVLQLEEALVAAHADASSIAYLTTTKVRRKLKGTTKVPSDAGAGFIWENGQEGFGTVNTYRAAASTNVPSNLVKGTSGAVCSAVLAGDFSQVYIGNWGGLDILIDPYTLGTSGAQRIIALQDVDVALRLAACFAAILDATT